MGHQHRRASTTVAAFCVRTDDAVTEESGWATAREGAGPVLTDRILGAAMGTENALVQILADIVWTIARVTDAAERTRAVLAIGALRTVVQAFGALVNLCTL